MTTLIILYPRGGSSRRCDGNCHDARSPKCTCICGGKNHGVGYQQAVKNCDTFNQEIKDTLVSQGEESPLFFPNGQQLLPTIDPKPETPNPLPT